MIKKLFLGLIRMYQLFISPYLPKQCIYYPTCSDYTYQAIVKYGPFKGVFLGMKRIFRCTPWHRGGYDPLL